MKQKDLADLGVPMTVDTTPKTQSRKERFGELDFLKLGTSALCQTLWRRQATDRDKRFAKDRADKGLLFNTDEPL